jgi:siroheme synthase-like protein
VLEGASLVFAATDRPEVNGAVVRDAMRLGVFVNRADDGDETPGDFSTPAVLREGQLTVTVSAGGSPAVAAAVRDRLRERMDGKWVRMAEVATEYRPYLMARGATAEIRRAIYRDLASDEAMDVLEARGREGLSEWLKDRHPGL